MSEDGVMINIPSDFSTGGLTFEDRGYKQQTFLGASISNFTMVAGFGDESSTLSIELVEDEYNIGDGTAQGSGADVYHNGKHDEFVPPFIGSPVFFTFGKDYADIPKAYLGVYDYIYNSGTTSSGVTISSGSYQGAISGVIRSSLASNEYYDIEKSGTVEVEQDDNIGRGHITFGGILQSFVETRSPQGNSIYSVKVSDPREILNSVNLILNNFSGSINKTDNLYNIYGFLEHNISDQTLKDLGGEDAKDVIIRHVAEDGSISYSGTDTFLPSGFPITGTGFSRRSERGIPFYRVAQTINTLFGSNINIPKEYEDMSFGDKINFRGLKYVVDLSGLPPVPDFYNLDFDSMSLLDLCLEICDITNTDLYVTLLPVLDKGVWSPLYQKNKTATKDTLVAGIIRVDAIDRKKQPSMGAIQQYLKDLTNKNIYVRNSDVGFELSNITTDKFIVGAQECNMHFFSTNADKDFINENSKKNQGNQNQNGNNGEQWKLTNALQQQIIPYYGTLGNNYISPPRGWGAYQQILLDSTGLNANGVGNYYVATEMELRCVLAGYDKWVQFLLMYNDKYLEPMPEECLAGKGLDGLSLEIGDKTIDNQPNRTYGVTVPKSVFPAYAKTPEDSINTCNPPLGWPLYYKRALNIGIPQAGFTTLQYTWNTQILPKLYELKQKTIDNKENIDHEKYIVLINQTWDNIKNKIYSGNSRELFADLVEGLEEKIKNNEINLIEERIENSIKTSISFSKFFKKGTRNAQSIYNFLRDIANECLGKKYLVKIPKKVNFCFDKTITYGDIDGVYKEGPFGFRPHPKTSDPITKHDKTFIDNYKKNCDDNNNPIITFLSSGNDINSSLYLGALDNNYNPFADKFEFNYYPETEGGFFPEDIYKEILSPDKALSIREIGKDNNGFSGLNNQLIPLDLPKFINDNNRICTYVRFDHSEDLYAGELDHKDFSQETITTHARIPDISYGLDNIDSESNNFHSFKSNKDANNNQNDTNTKQVLFVKCNIDPDFYYVPNIIQYSGMVYNGVSGILEISQPREVYDAENDSYNVVATYPTTHFKPTIENAKQASNLLDFETIEKTISGRSSIYINTNDNMSDIQHIYALITLPSKIEPLVDARFRDGPYQLSKPENIKHFLTMDVVKNFEPFQELAYAKQPPALPEASITNLPPDNNAEITRSSIDIVQKLQYAFPQQIDFKVPSPVVPDLAVIPLRSTERCYGPWSSQWIDTRTENEQKNNKKIETRFIELGGPVEFIKEENLSPWNYAGYTGLNSAGKLQAAFANNLLLLSERGSFSYADAPQNVYLAEELKKEGPLVTNINVSISPAGIITTVQLDLYTVSFGKLHKYRQQKLQQSAREKLKLRDEKNALIRKNLGKNQKNEDYNILYNRIDHEIKSASNALKHLSRNGIGSAHSTNLIATINKNTTKGININTSQETDVIRQGVEISTQSMDDIAITSENFNSMRHAGISFSNSAGGSLKDMYSPMSNDPYYIGMPYRVDSFHETKINFYPQVTFENNDLEDFTIYEE